MPLKDIAYPGFKEMIILYKEFSLYDFYIFVHNVQALWMTLDSND